MTGEIFKIIVVVIISELYTSGKRSVLLKACARVSICRSREGGIAKVDRGGAGVAR